MFKKKRYIYDKMIGMGNRNKKILLAKEIKKKLFLFFNKTYDVSNQSKNFTKKK